MRKGFGYAKGNGVTLYISEFKGAFALCNVSGAEFLDSNFQRPPGGLLKTADPQTVYLRIAQTSVAGAQAVTLGSRREDGTSVEDGISLPVARVGSSSTAMGSFTIVPDGYLESVPPGPLVHVAIADGQLTAKQAAGGGAGAARVSLALEQVVLASVGSVGLVKGRAEAIGFARDQVISRFPNPADKIDPLDYEPVWGEYPGTPNPVCYTVGAQPAVFGTLRITSIDAAKLAGLKADILACNATGGVLGRLSGVTLSGTGISFRDLMVTGELPTSIKLLPTQYYWWIRLYETTPGSGGWSRIGVSGPHEIYWTQAQCVTKPFGRDDDALYDEALRRALTGINGDFDLATVLKKITEQVERDITYKPKASPIPDHPLKLYSYGGSLCSDNARLLRGLFQTLGVEAQVRYVWNGTTDRLYAYSLTSGDEVGFQVSVKAIDGIPPNPHFKFHAVVDANGDSFDPSYGIYGFTSLDFLEAVGTTSPYSLLVGSAANTNQQTRVGSMPPVDDALPTGVVCPHTN